MSIRALSPYRPPLRTTVDDFTTFSIFSSKLIFDRSGIIEDLLAPSESFKDSDVCYSM